jgi:hypothetical protein
MRWSVEYDYNGKRGQLQTATNRSIVVSRGPANKIALPLFEIARVLVRFDHVASFIVNANHSVM